MKTIRFDRLSRSQVSYWRKTFQNASNFQLYNRIDRLVLMEMHIGFRNDHLFSRKKEKERDKEIELHETIHS